MQYNYIAVSSVIFIDKVYYNNIIIILGELYQISFCKSRFNHNNGPFNTFSQHKIHLMYVNTLCVHKLKTRITYKYYLDHKLKITKVTKNIEK